MATSVIKVKFHNGSEHYFTSFAAIYTKFNDAEIGITLPSLWSAKVTEDNPKVTKRCIISRHPLYSKQQTSNTPDSDEVVEEQEVVKSPFDKEWEQYESLKQQHPDTVLLFRVGSFYELKFDDALLASQVLGLTVTRRFKGSKPMHLAGFPSHAIQHYVQKLVNTGHRVAICENLENNNQPSK